MSQQDSINETEVHNSRMSSKLQGLLLSHLKAAEHYDYIESPASTKSQKQAKNKDF